MSTTRAHRDHDSSTKGIVAGGGTIFAATMLGLTGVWQVLAGIAAIANDDIYVLGGEYSYSFDITAWGWVHLVIGALAIAIAVGIFSGNQWALSAGIGVAFVSSLSNFAFLPYYPLWAIVVLAFDAFIIWALCQRLMQAD
ncbi:hypothetical protein HN031_15760 [Nocardioides sp. zg-1308]|uniref:DUF7144 domain-containing protein n=1 Tax=Nocardioides renjunii TaxID=3095075 RepID=A0ABU5KB13_9ACTN|nr:MULTISPECIES: hypothetical protein [unclassified Nocardioides]MDZ5662158.1 hypothetical protein [Nocardioides sp. S-58]NPD06136.1 hypothetical protein [Nocardioides sp. zg-1308]WQQ20338.1 hypothetical protein SHK17_10480 [Nocardioides sp. S-34]